MKNLKKVLALVLVVASLMGLATMASATTSEDYSDGDSISHVEAVDIMSTIGVFDGISGAFSGDSILTREQAAKIITYMILGKDDADALVASVAPYTDVSRDRWSAGSIAYCKNEGILAGVGNGRFEPDGKLTGVAFAKMCLVALGYDPDVQQLTGPQWAVNTSKLAIADAGISANLSQISLADEMSREDACQMAFNTLKADLVWYEDRGTNITIPGSDGKNIVISDSPSKAEPVGKDVSRVDEKHNFWNIKKDDTLQFGERYFPKLKKSSDKDSFGRPATTWQYKSNEVGTYVDTTQLIQSWTAKAPKGEMHSAIGGSIIDKLEYVQKIEEGGTYQFASYVDGRSVYDISHDVHATYRPLTSNTDNYFNKNSTSAAGTSVDTKNNPNNKNSWNVGMSGNGVLTELYMDDDDNVTVVMINTYLVQATADFNTVTDRVNIEPKPIDDGKPVDNSNQSTRTPMSSFLPTYISNDDFDVSGVKDGDYLLVTAYVEWGNENIGSTEIKSVTPATVQTGSVTEYTDREDVTIGGTKYEYNRILGDDEKGEEFAINSDATLVLDTYGYIMFVDEALTSSNFVYIDNFGSTNSMKSHPIADAYFADGTNNEISVSRVDDVKDKNTIANKYSSKERLEDEDVGARNYSSGVKHLYSHWYTFSGSSGGDYALNTPNQKRYESPYIALTSANSTGNAVNLIKSKTVNFMSEALKKNQVDVYALWEDTWVDSNNITHHEPKIKKADEDYVQVESNSTVEVKGDEKTIFVIKDEFGDVTSYTGISKVPDVKLKDNHAGLSKVSWICKRNSNHYASYVFVDVSNGGAVVDGGASIADYMFTLKSTGNETHVDGLTYYKYKVMIDGKEDERWISSALVDGDYEKDRGTLFYDIKEDSDGRIKDGKRVGDKGNLRQFRAEMNGSDTIDQSGNSLYISALHNAQYKIATDTDTNVTTVKDYLIANSGSSINVVIKGGAHDDLLYDDGADYEVHQNVSANFVKSFLGNYKLEGKVFVVVDDDDRDLIENLWIYVSKATPK